MVSTTTDFDSGGGVEVEIDGDHVDLEMYDREGYSNLGYFCFRLEGAAGETLTFDVTNRTDSYMPSDYRLYMTADLENLDWEMMDEEVGGGFEQEFEDDEAYICTFRGYPYQNTVDRINDLEDEHPDLVESEVIGQSADHELDMYAMRIDDHDVPDEDKLEYWILTRQHPGETKGSYHTDAAVDYILTQLETDGFEQDYRFHVIPHANPDGMYDGLQRYDSNGDDPNRLWDDGDENVEIEHMKEYLRENIENEPWWGIDYHDTTVEGYDVAIWYDSRAVAEHPIGDDIVSRMSTESLSFPGTTDSTTADSRSRGFYYSEFGGSMVSSEAWAFRQYTEDELEQEGVGYFTATLPEDRSQGVLSIGGQPITTGGQYPSITLQ